MAVDPGLVVGVTADSPCWNDCILTEADVVCDTVNHVVNTSLILSTILILSIIAGELRIRSVFR